MSRVMTNKITSPPAAVEEPPLFEVGDVIVYEYIEADGDWQWALASVEGLLSSTVLDVTAWEPIYSTENRFLTPMSNGSRDKSDIATSWRKMSSDIGSDESFGSDESNIAQYLILNSSVVCSVRKYSQILIDANVHTAHGEWDGILSTATEGIDFITLRHEEVLNIRSSLEGHSGATKEQMEQLKSSLKAMTARCSTAEAERHAVTIRSNKLEKSLVNSTCTEAHLHTQLSDAKKQVASLQEDLDMEKERIQPTLQDSSCEMDECQQQSAPPSHLDTFGPVLAEVHGPTQGDLYDHVAALEAIAAESQQKENQHKQALAAMDGALQKALLDIQHLTDTLNTKKAAARTNEDLERRIAEIQVDYDDAEVHITTLQTRTSELEIQLAATRATKETIQHETADTKARAADLESQLAAAKSAAEKDQTDASDAKARAADLESQLAAAKSAAEKDQIDSKLRIEELEDALLVLMNEREGGAKRAIIDKDKIEKLTKSLSELQTRHDALEEHHLALEANYDSLNGAYNLVAGNKWTRNSQRR